jgi:hypothetical protein
MNPSSKSNVIEFDRSTRRDSRTLYLVEVKAALKSKAISASGKATDFLEH